MEKWKYLAETICNTMIEKQLTQKDLMLAVNHIIKKFFNEANIKY